MLSVELTSMPLSKTWDQLEDALSVRSANAADSECQKVVKTLSLYRMDLSDIPQTMYVTK